MVTAALWPAIISGIAAIVAAFIGYNNHRSIRSGREENDVKLEQIHVMVDGRLDAALNQIKELKEELTYEKEQHHHAPIEEVMGDATLGHDHDGDK